MKKSKAVIAKNSREVSKALGLSTADAIEIEVRSELNDSIIRIVEKLGLTHAEVAKLAKTSRSRITAILNRNTQDVSTDLMLRIVASLGYRTKIQVVPAA
jgi:predicted XRE-type DNA-binding protein